MMAYIELHQALLNHRKTIAAADELGIPEVHLVGHLAALWCWCLDNCHDGSLPDNCRIICRAACWNADPAIFVAALQNAGFIDQKDGKMHVHDWDKYGGKLIEKRRTNADKQARYRESQQDQKKRNQDVTDTLPSRVALEKSRVEKSINTPLPPKGGRYSAEFLEFWTAYPRKKNKDDAWRAWKSRRDRPSVAELIGAVTVLVTSPGWVKDGGRFIPYPATWLRSGGWQDEPDQLPTGPNGMPAEIARLPWNHADRIVWEANHRSGAA